MTLDIQNAYSLLLDDLDLSPQERDALISFLVELQIDSMSAGEPTDENERLNGIATIIGEPKLEQFLALARNLREYAEIQIVQSGFQQKGIPMTEVPRDALFDILVETRSQYFDPTLQADFKRDSIEFLEYLMNQMDEYQRHVLELAPSVLSPEQVQYLFERYQAQSYKRAEVLEIQRKARADPTSEYMPLYYPPDF